LAQVPITIAGRTYRMACGEGEEAHLEGLAAELEGRISELRGAFGEIGDQRLIVMAALAFADERFEALKKIKTLEAQAQELAAANAAVEQTVGHWAVAATAAVEAAAARIEQTVQMINGAGKAEG
jgi:cell division protein ZapA